MERLLTAQRVLIVKRFYKNGACASETEQKLRAIVGTNEALCESTVRRATTKFETTGAVLMVKAAWRDRFCQTKE